MCLRGVVWWEGVIGVLMLEPMRLVSRINETLKKCVHVLSGRCCPAPPVLGDSGEERKGVWGGLTPQCVIAHLIHSAETFSLTPAGTKSSLGCSCLIVSGGGRGFFSSFL